jgi:thymidylate synthase (FAD)
MAHVTVPAAEELLDREFRVLDHGFVRLVDYLGSDERIVQSARVSYGAGTKTRREDKSLIDYLIRNLHTSPLEQVILTFHCKLPIFVARQWVRHRTARLNEISGRYSVMQDEFYLPAATDVRYQSKDNKQGRSTEELPAGLRAKVLELLKSDQVQIYGHYQQMIGDNLARELCRINLPLSLYTEWYWQIDLHNLFHFLRLRLDPHAQLEIRSYAEAMAKMAQAVAPLAYESFEEHILHGVRLSRSEVRAVRALLQGEPHGLGTAAKERLAEKIGPF